MQFAGQHDAGRCDVCHNAIVIFVTTDFCSAAAASLAFAAVKKRIIIFTVAYTGMNNIKHLAIA